MADPSTQRRQPRSRQGIGDLLRSLALVLLAVVVVVLITLRPDGQQVRVVDYRATLQTVRATAPFPLLAPVGLGDGWRATSATYDPPGGAARALGTTWHVGFVTPGDAYAGFEQTDAPVRDVLDDVLDQPRDEGTTTTVDGERWVRWVDDSSGHRALVRTDGRVSVVVDGSAGWDELQRLAASLEAQR